MILEMKITKPPTFLNPNVNIFSSNQLRNKAVAKHVQNMGYQASIDEKKEGLGIVNIDF